MNLIQKKNKEIKNNNNSYKEFQDEIQNENMEEINNNKNNKIIKILTYNFFLRPPPIKTNKNDYKEERLKDFFLLLNKFSIICFQEIFGAIHNRKHKMIKKAIENGFYYIIKSKTPSFFSKYLIDGGLLILSKFPIIESKYITFNYGILSDSLCMKGAIFAKIKIFDFYLCLFTTHLQASYCDSGNFYWELSIKVRTEQCEKLINFIYNIIFNIPIQDIKKCKFILVGDLNIDAHNCITIRDKYNLSKGIISEYDCLKKKLNKLGKAIDLFEKKFNGHPYTFGVNDDGYDQVLTSKADFNCKQTLDYMWEIIPDLSLPIYKKDNDLSSKLEFIPIDNSNINNIYNNENSYQLQILYDSPKVEQFLVKNKPYQQLSDHFGLSVQLTIKDNS